MKKEKFGIKFFMQIDILVRCQNEILEVCNRSSCIGDDQVATLRYWEIYEIIKKYNEEVSKIE